MSRALLLLRKLADAFTPDPPVYDASAVEELGARIVLAMQLRPPKSGARIALSYWMAEELTQADFELLGALEAEKGAAAANDWLCGVLVRSGRYVRDGAFVSAVET